MKAKNITQKSKPTARQKELLKQLQSIEKEILAHEEEIGRLQSNEQFDYANDEKSEADGDARRLLDILETEEVEYGMRDFPLVQQLRKKYIIDLSMAGGSACH